MAVALGWTRVRISHGHKFTSTACNQLTQQIAARLLFHTMKHQMSQKSAINLTATFDHRSTAFDHRSYDASTMIDALMSDALIHLSSMIKSCQ